jgi:hypothetical protein
VFAVAGLAARSGYLMGNLRGLAWAACAGVLVVAAFGFTMLLRRLPSSGRHSQGRPSAPSPSPRSPLMG